MSIQASLNLRVVQHTKPLSWIILPSSKIIQLLVDYGWNLINKDGNVTYIPPHDDEDYNWTTSPMSEKMIMKIIEEKEKLNEIVGIILTWQNTEIVGKILLWPEKQIGKKKTDISMALCFEADRKMIDNTNVTDVNWYLTKLLPAFNRGNTRVEYFSYDEL